MQVRRLVELMYIFVDEKASTCTFVCIFLKLNIYVGFFFIYVYFAK